MNQLAVHSTGECEDYRDFINANCIQANHRSDIFLLFIHHATSIVLVQWSWVISTLVWSYTNSVCSLSRHEHQWSKYSTSHFKYSTLRFKSMLSHDNLYHNGWQLLNRWRLHSALHLNLVGSRLLLNIITLMGMASDNNQISIQSHKLWQDYVWQTLSQNISR